MRVLRLEALPSPLLRRLALGLAAYPLVLVVALALLARLAALALVPHAIGMDGANFVRTAENLSDGFGYIGIRGSVNAVHVSLYPVLIAPLLWLGLRAPDVAVAISVVAGTLLVLPVYAIGRRLFDERAGLVAAAIVAIHPFTLDLSTAALADALALTLAFAGLAALLRSNDEPRAAWGAGALFGLAYVTRSEGLLYAGVGVAAVLVALLRTPRERPRQLARLVALTAAFAIFAVPYAIVLSRASGGHRVDAKGAVNYAIASRMAAGMSYTQAADGVGPDGRETGAELGAGFYETHPGVADPSLAQRLALAARVAPGQLGRLARLAASRAFGTPLFVLLGLAGYVTALRARRSRADAAVLLAIVALDGAALLTMDWLWPRIAAVFVPPLAIGAAAPLVALAQRIRLPAIGAAAVTLGAACACLAIAHGRADVADAAVLRQAGAWLETQAPGAKLVMAAGNEVAYYARGDWQPLPYASSADSLAYLHAKRPTYVVLEAADAGSRPYLAQWLRSGIPDPAARPVRTFAPGTPVAVAVYEWRGSAPPAVGDGVPPVVDPTIARASTVVWRAPAASRPHDAAPGIDVLTAHNDPQRLGWNAHERVLDAASVASRRFGKRFELPLDGQAYAQPLIVSGVEIPGQGRRNLLIAATENDSVYAFDADDGQRLWVHSFISCCGVTPARAQAIEPEDPCGSVRPVIGVSSTPVVDRRTGTVYVLAKTMRRDGDAATFHNTLHALALTTGADVRAPAEIEAVASYSLHSSPGRPLSLARRIKGLVRPRFAFDPRAQYNRTGLLLANGNVYAGFSSHCDLDGAHGWVFAYRASDLHRVGAFATTRDAEVWGGGVWQSGMGITADPAGDVYFTTGNGPFDAQTGGRDYADSLVKLNAGLDRVVDYFTPYTQAELSASDADFGGGAMLALPDGRGPHPHLGIVNSKVRALFVVDRDHLGRYADGGPDHALSHVGDERDDTHWCIGTCGATAYYRGRAGELIYDVWALDALRSYRLDRERGRLVETAHSRNAFPGSGGAIPSVSSNGERPGSAIVWATTRPSIQDATTRPIELYAYDAENVGRTLYHGSVSLWPNTVGHPFLTPTIANGNVYVGGDHSISVFGLHHQ